MSETYLLPPRQQEKIDNALRLATAKHDLAKLVTGLYSDYTSTIGLIEHRTGPSFLGVEYDKATGTLSSVGRFVTNRAYEAYSPSVKNMKVFNTYRYDIGTTIRPLNLDTNPTEPRVLSLSFQALNQTVQTEGASQPMPLEGWGPYLSILVDPEAETARLVLDSSGQRTESARTFENAAQELLRSMPDTRPS